ncbi:MAG: hypothetical protein U0N39_03220, partial [Faecalibacterium prausnitzii]
GIILSHPAKEKVKFFKIPADQPFFLFTLPQILGILMKYLCINCVFWVTPKDRFPKCRSNPEREEQENDHH